MTRKLPFAKDLRKLYPYAQQGHKKNCTCFVCGCKRDDLWQNDNPVEAQLIIDDQKREYAKKIELGKAIKSDPKVAKANRDYAILGNKYYKQSTRYGKDSIHCSECLQRLGGMSYPCPFGHGYNQVYGKMLNDPSDERWNDPLYNKSKFLTDYRDSMGNHVIEKSSAETELEKRKKDFGNTEDMK